ncbi:MAG: translation elongation factor Ts [Patescibacteria group bacterium]
MTIDITIIQTLRAKTGAGVADCKIVLEETNGDLVAAEKLLRERGAIKASKRTDKETNEGVITSYIHPGGRVGVLLMLTCETDFVARNEKFQQLARELAMQVAAADPLYIRAEDIPAADLEREKDIMRTQLANEGKPAAMIDKIIEGKLNAWYEEVCFLNQKYLKNEEITVGELINQEIASLGERIAVKRFVKFGLTGGNRGCGL